MTTAKSKHQRIRFHPLYYCLLIVAYVLTGCAIQPRPDWMSSKGTDTGKIEAVALATGKLNAPECFAFYDTIDKVIRATKQHTSNFPVQGYPFLRTNRFLSSFQNFSTPDQYKTWLSHLNRLAIDGIEIEKAGISRDAVSHLQAQFKLGSIDTNLLQRCGELLVDTVSQDLSLQQSLVRASQVESSYSLPKRTLGIYPVSSLFLKLGIDREHQSMLKKHNQFDAKEQSLFNYQYQLDDDEGVPSPDEFKWTTDSLGMPLINEQLKTALLRHYAPIISLPNTDEDNHPGEITLTENNIPGFKSTSAFVYTTLTFGRYRGQVITQLNYSIWFKRRPAKGVVDILAGEFDALVWRVNLLPSGEVLAYDSIHQCGCWYRVYPGQGFRLESDKQFFQEPVIAPKNLPTPQGNARVVLYLEADTHQLINVDVDSNSSANINKMHYSLLPYEVLYKLRNEKASIFDEAGILRNSQRPERWLLWTSGIESPGAMRDFGYHAIAFIGQRHFDDAYLLDFIYRE